MLESFLVSFVQMLKLFVYIALGYLFNRFSLLPKSAELVISRLNTLLFIPMLTLSAFISDCTIDNLTANSSFVIWGILFALFPMLFVYPLSRHFSKDLYEQRIWHYALTIPNTGAFATALSLSLYGNEGFFLRSLFALGLNLLCYSWGIQQLKPAGQNHDFKTVMKSLANPSMISILLGLILGLSNAGRWMPQIVLESISLFGSFFVPMSLFVVGFMVADYDIRTILPRNGFWQFVLIRMILIPLAAILILKAIHAPKMLAVIAGMCLASPCGMNTVVFPVSYGLDSRLGVTLVLFTSLLAGVIIPVFYSISL